MSSSCVHEWQCLYSRPAPVGYTADACVSCGAYQLTWGTAFGVQRAVTVRRDQPYSGSVTDGAVGSVPADPYPPGCGVHVYDSLDDGFAVCAKCGGFRLTWQTDTSTRVVQVRRYLPLHPVVTTIYQDGQQVTRDTFPLAA